VGEIATPDECPHLLAWPLNVAEGDSTVFLAPLPGAGAEGDGAVGQGSRGRRVTESSGLLKLTQTGWP
jgi:hypothetical protein